MMNREADEINGEDLEAAAQMFDDLADGTFYEKQRASGFPVRFIEENND